MEPMNKDSEFMIFRIYLINVKQMIFKIQMRLIKIIWRNLKILKIKINIKRK